MNKKLVKEFLIITFIIMIIFWGGCALISQIFNLTINNIFLRIMHIIGGFSPTIASYISLKRNNEVNNFKEWLKKIFDIKHNIYTYALVILFVAIYYILGCLINGFELGAPIFMLIVILPMMLFGGGNEEVGWRMILQPELEKKFGFNFATIITAIIWWLWHLPIFFIKGTVNADMNYFLFGIMCLMLSYTLATIRKISNGVFPCILTHCLINALSAILVFKFSWVSCCVSLIITILGSMLILNINKRFVEMGMCQMKKIFAIIGSTIVSLIITFIFASLFSLYSFGSVPTTLTLIYLVSLFSIFLYITLSICYITNKMIKKEKIIHNNIISMVLFFLTLLLILYFIFATNVDWLNYYSSVNSSPFYVTIVRNGIMILLPSAVLFIIGIVILKKKK